MLMPISRIFVVIVRARRVVILILVADGGMRTMAMIHLGQALLTTAIAHEAAMQSHGLRPAQREQR